MSGSAAVYKLTGSALLAYAIRTPCINESLVFSLKLQSDNIYIL